jgi:hypothetical protein
MNESNPTRTHSVGGRNYDSDNSFFNDIKQNLNENSFHEQILEKNKVHYN